MTLNELKTGSHGRIITVGGDGALRQHFLDMGLLPGVEVTLVKLAPMGDPVELRVRDYELTLRIDDAKNIEIEGIDKLTDVERKAKAPFPLPHPGFGQEGIYHSKAHEEKVDKDRHLTFALVGNQNCGKTTLFNRLTGANQHVGNFPGVTVDRKDGAIIGHPNTSITDLPGIYSMSPYTSEEIVSRNFVLKDKPTAIINIIDATNIHRNLYLTMQLLETRIPMVVAINMMDELTANGGAVNVNAMEGMLGVPVVPISAAKNQGINELIEHAVHIAKYNEKPEDQDFCDENDRDGALHRAIHGVIHLIEDHAKRADIPVRFAACKAIEGDELVIKQLALDENESDMLEHIVAQMEKEGGLDRSAAVAAMRYDFINKVCDATVIRPKESKERQRSERIDKFLTGKYTAIPAFILIMCLVFFLTFNVIGGFFQGLLESGIEVLTDQVDKGLSALNVNPVLHSLVIDGVFQGVGSVLSFLPIIITLFFFLSILEDSGYIARVAFFMDKLLRKIGLSGRSIVPLLIGFGCTVPAVMATRTLPSERDRKMTILLTPFMSCTAKLPIYVFFVDAFFPKHKALIMTGLYLLGILVGIGMAKLYKATRFKGEAVPFVMELPNYRLPAPKSVGQLLWEKSKDFLKKAFSIIFIATVLVWVLQTFDFRLNVVEDSGDSILAVIAGCLAPLMAPLGLNDWRIATSLISGVIAKESVVSTMEILFAGQMNTIMVPLSAATMLVFSLLYTPCVAAIASVKRELGGKAAIKLIIWQCMVAWLVAFIVHSIGLLFV